MMVALMMWALFVGLVIVVVLFYEENPGSKDRPDTPALHPRINLRHYLPAAGFGQK